MAAYCEGGPNTNTTTRRVTGKVTFTITHAICHQATILRLVPHFSKAFLPLWGFHETSRRSQRAHRPAL